MSDFISKMADTKSNLTPHMTKASLVDIFFPDRNLTLTYFNDCFVLNAGDMVYVEGKLEGHLGRVCRVNYAFKIKISDYKRVIQLVDTSVKGDFYLAGSHLITFDRDVIPYSKAR